MQAVFQKYLPAPSLHYCLSLWQQYEFDFKVTRPRQSKFGDFRTQPGHRERISVNGDCNPYSFLITYLHEVAHLITYRKHNRKAAPHGREWKDNFRELLQPVLNETVFPISILTHVRHYAQNPKASTASDAPLMLALGLYETNLNPITTENKTTLHQIAEGGCFVFRQKTYVRGTLRRSRYVIFEPKSKKQFLLPAHALVEKI